MTNVLPAKVILLLQFFLIASSGTLNPLSAKIIERILFSLLLNALLDAEIFCIAKMSCLIAAEFLCLFVGTTSHLVLRKHFLHLHSGADVRITFHDGVHLLLRCAGGEVGCPFLHARKFFAGIWLEFLQLKEMNLQLGCQLAAGLWIIDAEAAVHVRILLTIEQIESKDVNGHGARQLIVFVTLF